MSEESPVRRAHIETTAEDAETAAQIAAALDPDNTPEMETTVDGTTVRTTVGREDTGGLQATLDDYVVNLQVAVQLTAQGGDSSTTHHTTHE
jgi:hypothetical protein